MSGERTIGGSCRVWAMITVLGVGALTLTSCSPAENEEYDQAAIGENGEVGDVDLLNFLLVAGSEGEPGRFLGTVENESDQAVEVMLSDTDDEVTISVPAGDQFAFDTNETVFSTVGDIPGGDTMVSVTVGDESTDLTVPVVDGTLEQYQPYLPG